MKESIVIGMITGGCFSGVSKNFVVEYRHKIVVHDTVNKFWRCNYG